MAQLGSKPHPAGSPQPVLCNARKKDIKRKCIFHEGVKLQASEMLSLKVGVALPTRLGSLLQEVAVLPLPPSLGYLIISNSKPLTWPLSALRGRCAAGGMVACCSAAPGGGAGTSLEA